MDDDAEIPPHPPQRGSNNETTRVVASSPRGTTEDHGGKRRKGRKKKQHSLDHLKQRVSTLMAVFDEHGLFLPPPEFEKGKVWSNRNYGQDKKRQRKASDRAFLESRIAQLEACLTEHELLTMPTA